MLEVSTYLFVIGEYRKDELLEAARNGNDQLMLSLLTPLNVNGHASDGRKVGSYFIPYEGRFYANSMRNRLYITF